MKLRLNQKNIPLLATIAVFLLIYLAGSVLYSNFFSLRVLQVPLHLKSLNQCKVDS